MLTLGIVVLLAPTVWAVYVLTYAVLATRERRTCIGGAL